MLYDTIEIKPTPNGEWEILHRELPYHRKKGEQQLNATYGFFHYPRHWGKEKAFMMLRDRMIKERFNVIIDLVLQINKLRSLSL